MNTAADVDQVVLPVNSTAVLRRILQGRLVVQVFLCVPHVGRLIGPVELDDPGILGGSESHGDGLPDPGGTPGMGRDESLP